MAKMSQAMQENCGLKPAWANSFQDPILKRTHHTHKKGLVEWLKV
jgi:hypothetical protein